MNKNLSNSSTIGAFEAKTRFSQLLERVALGEEITITKHNQPVARLVPAQRTSNIEVFGIFQKLALLRTKIQSRKSNDNTSIKDLINEGRRF